jgi:gamma-glutamyl:cysteine ligase YbdK (ATP-grasp superfamily)
MFVGKSAGTTIAEHRVNLGQNLDNCEFDENSQAAFRARLDECLDALRLLHDRETFGVGPTTIGAELELFLIDDDAAPAPLNQKIREAARDPRIALELDRFNLELNSTPVPLAGHPFAALGREFEELLGLLSKQARSHDTRVVAIGILPTVAIEALRNSAITDLPRYTTLNHALRNGRGSPFEICIAGDDPLVTHADDVAFEGANTSFQVHLRVNPADFAATFNAIQLATAPVVAASGNSPLFLGHRLWEETRIALFKQAVDNRTIPPTGRKPQPRVSFGQGWAQQGALELFAEAVELHSPLLPVISDENPVEIATAGEVPSLRELRLHQGTVWRWNRPVYDGGQGGHLRVELRSLPAGPTIVDMLANSALHIGLALGLASDFGDDIQKFDFEEARTNFYRAAQFGLSAELAWPRDGRVIHRPAGELVLDLLPVARRGLIEANVNADEVDQLLGIVRERVDSGQTGAVWQRRWFERLRLEVGRDAALAQLVERYLANSTDGQPVHTWSAEH